MKKIKLTKAIVLGLCILLGISSARAFSVSNNDGEEKKIVLKPIGTSGTPIPHSPGRPVTNLLGIDGYNLYLYPVDDTQTPTITLIDENDTEVFSVSVLLDGSTEVVQLPSDLSGTYTVYYNIGGCMFAGTIEL